MSGFVKIHEKDNVAVALQPIPSGAVWNGITTIQEIPQGHKIALKDLQAGDKVIKYGFPIGHLTQPVSSGEWIHVHNMKTDLGGESDYQYEPEITQVDQMEEKTFLGYRRKDGSVGIRNEIWVIPTVGCVNDVTKALVAQNQDLVSGSLEGLYAFTHPFGCSQTGEDHARTRKLLAALAKHPNAAAVLIVGLGCENLTMQQFKEELGDFDKDRIQFMICQDIEDEVTVGRELLKQCAEYAKQFSRESISAKELVIGLKCGGSDGLSGVTANPVVGKFSDMLISQGGTTVLTEVPEMFGAEGMLMNRCINEDTFRKAVDMINGFKYTNSNKPYWLNGENND